MSIPWWSWAWPLLAWVILGTAVVVGGGGVVLAAAGIVLIATVFAAVYHAEIVAHRIGEPVGTLVLAVAVTVIEVALIVSVMIAHPDDKAGLARDTVFAAVMLVCNGIVGLCLLVGGARHHEQDFQLQGASAALAVLAALTTLSLIHSELYDHHFRSRVQHTSAHLRRHSIAGPAMVPSCSSRPSGTATTFFRPVEAVRRAHAPPPSKTTALISGGLLIVSLIAVVGLAKVLTPIVELGVARAGVPKAVVGIVIAALVLLPEGTAAVRAAHANRLQTSLNLALGSALASIGLTIPAVAVVSVVIDLPLALGLDGKSEILLALTLLVGVVTLGTGRTTVLQGMVHLVILAAFLFLAIVP